MIVIVESIESEKEILSNKTCILAEKESLLDKA